MGDIEVTGAAGLRRLAAKLRSADLSPEVRRELGTISGPLLADVRANQLAIPSHGTKHTGLRQALAAVTKVQVDSGMRGVRLRVMVDPMLMPPGQQAMPAAMQSDSFTHPVFGREPKVTQHGHPYRKNVLPQARAAVDRAAQSMIRKLS